MKITSIVQYAEVLTIRKLRQHCFLGNFVSQHNSGQLAYLEEILRKIITSTLLLGKLQKND